MCSQQLLLLAFFLLQLLFSKLLNYVSGLLLQMSLWWLGTTGLLFPLGFFLLVLCSPGLV